MDCVLLHNTHTARYFERATHDKRQFSEWWGGQNVSAQRLAAASRATSLLSFGCRQEQTNRGESSSSSREKRAFIVGDGGGGGGQCVIKRSAQPPQRGFASSRGGRRRSCCRGQDAPCLSSAKRAVSQSAKQQQQQGTSCRVCLSVIVQGMLCSFLSTTHCWRVHRIAPRRQSITP